MFGVLPSTSTVPLVAGNKPAIMDKIVVFPHPDGPTIEINSYFFISKFGTKIFHNIYTQ